MKLDAVRKLREKLSRGEATHGMWITLQDATTAEIGVALGSPPAARLPSSPLLPQAGLFGD